MPILVRDRSIGDGMTSRLSAHSAEGGLNRLRSIVGGSAGNLVELYDWFAYASFTLYFAKVFFPHGDRTAQLLSSAAVFAVGFLARPIAALRPERSA